MKKTVFVSVLILLMLAVCASGVAASSGPVYIVQIDDTIDRQMETLLDKAIQEANENMAALLIVEVDTYGGYLDNAIEMKDVILQSPVTTVTFVNHQALSAGVLISMAGQRLYMAPGSTMGAAEARAGEEKADEKTMSAWVGELRSVAEARGKDGDYLAAMADSDIVIEDLTAKDELLTLSDAQCLEFGLSDGTMNNYADICTEMGVTATETVMVELSGVEKFANFITNPIVSGILIALGIIGIILELLGMGMGFSAILGICCLALYFAGHMIVSSVGWVAILLFVLGVVLIILEIFVIPGFGVAGLTGGAAIIVTIFLLAPSPTAALLSLIIAVVLTTAVLIFSYKNMKTRKVWRKLVLKDKTDSESGYTAPNMDNEVFLGREGVALSILRPAGAIDIDGQRVDVITEGDFLAAGTKVRVIGLDGTRIVVRAVRESEEKPAD